MKSQQRSKRSAEPAFQLNCTEAIAYCYKTLGHAQGTTGCIAFWRGAEWALEQVRAASVAVTEPKAKS